MTDQFALIRNGNVMFTGNEQFIAIHRLPGDTVWPYEGPKTNTAHVNFIDDAEQKVRAINEVTAQTPDEVKAFRNTKRAVSFPYVADQVGAILKQLEQMTQAKNRHPEFQAVLDAVAEVKQRVA